SGSDPCLLRRGGLAPRRRLDPDPGECLRLGLPDRVLPLASGLAVIGETELREVIELLPFDLRALPFARHRSRLRLPLRSAPAPAAPAPSSSATAPGLPVGAVDVSLQGGHRLDRFGGQLLRAFAGGWADH